MNTWPIARMREDNAQLHAENARLRAALERYEAFVAAYDAWHGSFMDWPNAEHADAWIAKRQARAALPAGERTDG